jgi:hypothetical protein
MSALSADSVGRAAARDLLEQIAAGCSKTPQNDDNVNY